MAYNPYGGNPYGQPPSYNPYPGANPMGYPGSAPPGMSPPPGMAQPPGVHSATHTNRPSGLPPSFQPPPNLPNINFNAPVIRLGGANGPATIGSPSSIGGNGVPNGVGMGVPGAPTGPSGNGGGASSLPARPNLPQSAHSNGGGGYGGRRGGEPDTPMSAGGPPMRPDFRSGGGGSGGGDRYDNRFDNRYEPRGERFDRYERGERGDRNDRDRGDRNDRDRHDRAPGGGDRDRAASGNIELQRAAVRDNMHANVPPTNDEKLKTIFVHKVPDGVGGEAALEKLMSIVGRLQRFDAAKSHLADHEGKLFAFAQYEDVDSLASAIELLREVKVPVKKQEPKEEKEDDEPNGHKEEDKEDKEDKDDKDDKKDEDKDNEETDPYKDTRKTTLQIAVDPVSLQLIETHQEKQSDEAKAEANARREVCRTALKAAIHKLFYPPPPQEAHKDADGDIAMTDGGLDPALAAAVAGIEVLNIPLAAQEDELADVPEEMRAMVASEIASFRDRSTQRDLERLKREQEMEELERRRNGDEPLTNGKPRGGAANVDRHGERERERPRRYREDPDTDASDDELYGREQRKQKNEDEKLYQEAERKWANRERQRAAALEREKDRDRAESDNAVRRREEALEHDKAWDDEREAQRKSALYYRDHAAWQRKRAHERADEESKDAADRRAEQEEQRKQAAEMEAARGMADSFLAQQAEEMDVREDAPTEKEDDKSKNKTQATGDDAPQKVTISFGAAAQRNQAQRAAATRRTVAEVEGLLDDEEQDDASKRRQLVPITFEPMSAAARMSDEELNQAVRALAQEIPTEREGLWAWPVAWTFLDKDESSIIRDKLRPFVEKKVVEYLGVQEQFLVEVVEQHLRKHGLPQELVEELQEALDEAAEDLVKKLWRMVIFFTESEKRGLPA